MNRDQNIARQSIVAQFAMPDERSFGVFKMLSDVYPAFSKKVLEGNELMQRLVMTGMNPMDIMDYPICGKCETLAPYSGIALQYNKRVRKCTCVKPGCGATTVNPVTFRRWIKDEMKSKAPPEFIDALEVAVDVIAQRMLDKYILEMRSNALAFREIARKGMGVTDQTYELADKETNKPHIQHMGSVGKPNLPKDRIEIEDSLEENEDEE